MSELISKHCKPCEGGVSALDQSAIEAELKNLHDWSYESGTGIISRDVSFENYYETMAFVNAVAWMAHRENHHPDLEVGYNHCKVNYTTHAINGVSENDLICAQKVDALLI